VTLKKRQTRGSGYITWRPFTGGGLFYHGVCIGVGPNISTGFNMDTAKGHGLDDCGSIPDSGKRLFSSSQPPDELWGQKNLTSNGYRGLFP
jgi:hypothetical protein